MKILSSLIALFRRESELERLLAFAQKVNNDHAGNDCRVMRYAILKFREFVKHRQAVRDTGRAWFYNEMATEFKNYLLAHSKTAEGAKSYFGRFHTLCRQAVRSGIISADPCQRISIPSPAGVTKKSILTAAEIQCLASTHYKKENSEVRRAFLFALVTGIRLCDIKELRVSDIDFSCGTLTFEQNKTKGTSTSSRVSIFLNDSVMQLLPACESRFAADRLLFSLPSRPSIQKQLDIWMREAGIAKHITFHCARHSAAVNMLLSGVDIRTVQSILGHSSIRMTERYLQITDARKAEALGVLSSLLPKQDV